MPVEEPSAEITCPRRSAAPSVSTPTQPLRVVLASCHATLEFEGLSLGSCVVTKAILRSPLADRYNIPTKYNILVACNFVPALSVAREFTPHTIRLTRSLPQGETLRDEGRQHSIFRHRRGEPVRFFGTRGNASYPDQRLQVLLLEQWHSVLHEGCRLSASVLPSTTSDGLADSFRRGRRQRWLWELECERGAPGLRRPSHQP